MPRLLHLPSDLFGGAATQLIGRFPNVRVDISDHVRRILRQEDNSIRGMVPHQRVKANASRSGLLGWPHDT